MLIAVTFLACARKRAGALVPLDVEPSRTTARLSPPPPPPPVDPAGEGPANPPREIVAILSAMRGAEHPPRVILYRLGERDHAREPAFNGYSVIESDQLPPGIASQVLNRLYSAATYSESHPLCTDGGIGLRVQSSTVRLDLIVGLICRHVHDGVSGEEIAFLSVSGQEFFVNLAARVNARP